MSLLLVYTSWYPSHTDSYAYPFVRQQVKIMQEHLGDGWKVVVWHDEQPIDLPSTIFKNGKTIEDKWFDQGIPIYHTKGLICSHRIPFNQNGFRLRLFKRTYNLIMDLYGPLSCTWSITLSAALNWQWFSRKLHISSSQFLQEHSNPLSMHLKHGYKKKEAVRLSKNLTHVCVVAQRQIPEFKKVSADFNCELINNPVDQLFLTEGPRTYSNDKFIYVGRLSKEKGLERMISAVELLRFEGINIELSIVGYGPYLEILTQLVKDKGLENSITFLGAADSSRIVEYLDDHTFFILPSFYENCPVALLEAQARGLICLVTQNDGSEHVLLKEAGIVVDEQSNGNAIKEGIKKILDDKDKYKRQLINSLAKRAFSPDTFANKMDNIIKKVML